MSEELILAQLRAYQPRNYQKLSVTVWHRLPVARRALVFVLLFLGHFGELRVILTRRSSKLRNFPGHISLPGGKADDGLESEWNVARREMSEEIGLSEDNDFLVKHYGFTIDHLNALPCYLSRTFLAVRPCVGFMNFKTGQKTRLSESEVIRNLELTMNPGESSSIFLCPLRDFLYPVVDEAPREALERTYHAVKWGGIPWHLRLYTFLQNNANEADWLKDIKDLSESSEDDAHSPDEEEKSRQSPPPGTKARQSSWGRLGSRRDSDTNEKIYDVWGLTANILHDLAEVMYLKEVKNDRELGEEELIYSLWHHGNQMQAKERSPEELSLIGSTSQKDDLGFNDILPRTEFNRLKKLYQSTERAL